MSSATVELIREALADRQARLKNLNYQWAAFSDKACPEIEAQTEVGRQAESALSGASAGLPKISRTAASVILAACAEDLRTILEEVTFRNDLRRRLGVPEADLLEKQSVAEECLTLASDGASLPTLQDLLAQYQPPAYGLVQESLGRFLATGEWLRVREVARRWHMETSTLIADCLRNLEPALSSPTHEQIQPTAKTIAVCELAQPHLRRLLDLAKLAASRYLDSGEDFGLTEDDVAAVAGDSADALRRLFNIFGPELGGSWAQQPFLWTPGGSVLRFVNAGLEEFRRNDLLGVERSAPEEDLLAIRAVAERWQDTGAWPSDRDFHRLAVAEGLRPWLTSTGFEHLRVERNSGKVQLNLDGVLLAVDNVLPVVAQLLAAIAEHAPEDSLADDIIRRARVAPGLGRHTLDLMNYAGLNFLMTQGGNLKIDHEALVFTEASEPAKLQAVWASLYDKHEWDDQYPPLGPNDRDRFRVRSVTEKLDLLSNLGKPRAWFQRRHVASKQDDKDRKPEPTASAANALEQPAGTLTERYSSLKSLGEGAYGHVWTAYDNTLKRRVAVKFVSRSGPASKNALAHAQALARVPHANIVTVHDVVDLLDPATQAKAPAVVMELVEGEVLSSVLGRHLDVAEAGRIGSCLIAAIREYHRLSLAHHDLHDGNVIVGASQVKVLDPLYFDTGLVASTASRESLQGRDLRDLRDLLRRILMATDMPLQEVPRFEQSTVGATLDELGEQFQLAIGVGCDNDTDERDSREERLLTRALSNLEQGHFALLRQLRALPVDSIDEAALGRLIPALRELGSATVVRAYWVEMLGYNLVWHPRDIPQYSVGSELGAELEGITGIRPTALGLALLDRLDQDARGIDGNRSH